MRTQASADGAPQAPTGEAEQSPLAGALGQPEPQLRERLVTGSCFLAYRGKVAVTCSGSLIQP